MASATPPIVIEPKEAATAAVIWLHGLGADGHDFEPIVPLLGNIPSYTRFVFPHAPERAVTINNGMVMRAWYDIVSMDIEKRADAAGVRDSEAILQKLVHTELEKGIPLKRIVLAGFSQGGAIVLHSGVRFPSPLAGIIALSTYLPLPELTDVEAHPANKNIPIFMGHGTFDPVVPLDLAKKSRAHLAELGYHIDWHTYPMEHSLSPPQIGDIAGWLASIIPPQ
ncbi:MAG: carboxylesterase [Gammaproteobacteria bacterium]|nr:carboxylesterase [Gammaproteobacteria bacterium]